MHDFLKRIKERRDGFCRFINFMFCSRLCCGINIYENKFREVKFEKLMTLPDRERWRVIPFHKSRAEHRKGENERKNIEDEIKKKPEINIEIKSCSRFFRSCFLFCFNCHPISVENGA